MSSSELKSPPKVVVCRWSSWLNDSNAVLKVQCRALSAIQVYCSSVLFKFTVQANCSSQLFKPTAQVHCSSLLFKRTLPGAWAIDCPLYHAISNFRIFFYAHYHLQMLSTIRFAPLCSSPTLFTLWCLSILYKATREHSEYSHHPPLATMHRE